MVDTSAERPAIPHQALALREEREVLGGEEHMAHLIFFSSTASQKQSVSSAAQIWDPGFLRDASFSLTLRSPPLSLLQSGCKFLTNPSHPSNYPSWSLLSPQVWLCPISQIQLFSLKATLFTGAKIIFFISQSCLCTLLSHVFQQLLITCKIKFKFLIQSPPTTQLYTLPLSGSANLSHLSHVRLSYSWISHTFASLSLWLCSCYFLCLDMNYSSFLPIKLILQDGAQMSPFLGIPSLNSLSLSLLPTFYSKK